MSRGSGGAAGGRDGLTPAARWLDVLTALEADIAAAEVALVSGQVPQDSALDLPARMDPLPPELRLRAWAVHDRAAAVRAALADATASAARMLSAVSSQRTERLPSVYVDSRC